MKLLLQRIAVFLVIITGMVVQAAPDDIIFMPDNAFKKIINSKLGRGRVLTDITEGDMTSLTGRLYVREREVVDITGLEYAININEIDLYESSVVDISALRNLTKLSKFEARFHKIADISPLKKLTKLTYLNLYGNQISDISSLENLTKLTYLNLYGNQISDISSLENLTNLESLHLGSNEITDVSSLENLTNLTSLTLNSNQINDISSLENLTNLTEFNIASSKQLSNFSVLKNFTKLRILVVKSCPLLVDLSMLKKLTSLRSLYVGYNQIKDIAPLENLVNLETLSLEYNQISNLSALANLTKLRYLDLDYNQIIDISPLANLTNSFRVELSHNQIRDISPIKPLVDASVTVWANNQTIELPPIITYAIAHSNEAQSIIDQDGNEVSYSININSHKRDWYKSYIAEDYWRIPSLDKLAFSGTIKQSVEFRTKIAINFEANGGDGSMLPQETDSAADTVALKANEFTRSGYTFIGWKSTAGLEGVGDGIVEDEQTVTITKSSVTLTAQWEEIVTPALGFEAVLEDGTLRWTVGAELGVEKYVVKDVSGNVIETVLSNGSGSYSVELPDGVEDVFIEVVDTNGSRQTFAPEAGNVQTTVYDLRKGWNLIAVTADNADFGELEKAAVGTLWSWNGESYVKMDSAEATNAVWVYVNAARQVAVSGKKSSAGISVKTGWNMVGPVENCRVPATALSVFEYEADSYTQLRGEEPIMLEGVGYWIFSF